MRKKFTTLHKDIDAQKEEIKRLFDQVAAPCCLLQCTAAVVTLPVMPRAAPSVLLPVCLMRGAPLSHCLYGCVLLLQKQDAGGRWGGQCLLCRDHCEGRSAHP
jgi:hypothetical protein